jgi:hypothetical protein
MAEEDRLKLIPLLRYSNYLCIAGHLGGEIYNRNKSEERAEKDCKIGNEIQVIIKYNSSPGELPSP